MNYRIKETPRGKFYVERKRWWGWSELGRYMFTGKGGLYFRVRYYDTLDEAREHLEKAKQYHAKEKGGDRVVHEE